MKKKDLPKIASEKKIPHSVQKPTEKEATFQYADILGLGLMILLGIAIYSNSFDCSFQFDDFRNIVEHKNLQNLSNVKGWFNLDERRIVAVSTFVLNYHFNQFDIKYWHYVNLAIHLINACLVYWFTALLFSAPILQNNPITRHKNLIALSTALLFVSHPLATESVTYIVQRMASLAALFYLLSLSLYLKARLINKENIWKYLCYTGAIISAILAFGTKENTFTLPFAIMLLEIFFLQEKVVFAHKLNKQSTRLIALFICAAILIVSKASFVFFETIPPSSAHNNILSPFTYLLTQFSVILKYIQLLCLPIHQNLDYDFPVSMRFFEIRTFLSFLTLSALILLAIYIYNKNRIVSFGICWFFLTLSIESSIIPIDDVIVEHRTYLPSVGFFILVSSLIFHLCWNKNKFLAIAILGAIIASNSFLTYERNKVWKTEFTLWNDVVSKSPNKARGYLNRGNYYRKNDNNDLAIADYTKTLEIEPKFEAAYQKRGLVYLKEEKYEQASSDFTKAIELNPTNSNAYFNRGGIYFKQGLFEKSINDYTKEIGINPTNSLAYTNRAISYASLQQSDKAIADYLIAIKIDPKNPSTYNSLASTYGMLEKWDEAIVNFSISIGLDSKNAQFYLNRGLAYCHDKQWDKAIADFTKAIELNPKLTAAYSNRDLALKFQKNQR